MFEMFVLDVANPLALKVSGFLISVQLQSHQTYSSLRAQFGERICTHFAAHSSHLPPFHKIRNAGIIATVIERSLSLARLNYGK
jgi:hypothetical protein